MTDRISLRLDDPSAEPAIIVIVNQYFANQVACQLLDARRLHVSFVCALLAAVGARYTCGTIVPVRLMILSISRVG
jgi:hypothetical protein